MVVDDTIERHTMAVLVDNEAGVLARVIGLFSGRGYNIESLTVAETDADEGIGRITIVTSGTPMIIEQIKAQLDRLVPVHRVVDLTTEGASVERELALVKVAGKGNKRVEALRIADIFRARAIDSTNEIFRVRNLRFDGEAECVCRPDGTTWPGRCFTNGCRGYCAREVGALESAPQLAANEEFLHGKVER